MPLALCCSLQYWGVKGVGRSCLGDSVVLCGQADALQSYLPSEAWIAKPVPQNLLEMHILASQPGLN